MRLYSPKKNRIVEIDFIRGVLIVFMMVDHFFYDFTSFGALKFIFPSLTGSLVNCADWYWSWQVRIITRFIILCTFFLISGISCYFSKNNLKRGILLSVVGALISGGFTIFSKYIAHDESMTVFFGAISSFGLSVLIYTLLKFLYDLIFKEKKQYFKYVMLVLGALSIWLGVSFGVFRNAVPYVDLRIDTFFFIIIGKNQYGGADWLPLFPYIGFMFIGAALGEVLYKERVSYFPPLPKSVDENASTIRKIGFYSLYPYKGFKNTICFAGKYSLYFYILHQPVIILVSSLILLMLGYKIQL